MHDTIDDNASPSGWGALLSGRNGLYALALAGGVTLHAVNMYIATTVMPSVVVDIGGLDFYAWATTLFVVGSILGAALTAKLLKRSGPRGAYVAATLIFALGTLICSLAVNMPVMLAGRSIQGLGGGFLYALAYGLTRVVLPEPLWGRSIGLIAAIEAKATERLLPRRAFSIATPLGALYVTIALLMLGMQPEIFVPYLLQHLHGQSPLWAGYLAALMAIGWTVASFLSSRWQESGGDRLLLAGPVLTLTGLVLLALFLPTRGGGSPALLAFVCLGLVLIGFGIGVAWPSLVTRVYQSAPATEQDLAAGGMTTVQLFAMAFGTACAGMVANLAGISNPGGLAGAASAALWLGALFALAPALAIALRVVRLTGGKA